MYADTITGSMQRAIDEVERRRRIQEEYNREHGITPQGIKKAIRDITERVKAAVAEEKVEYTAAIPPTREEIARLVRELEKQMKAAAKNLEFEKATMLRDKVIELRRELVTSELPQ
jgi:excinuclease ABC subunit B